MPLNNDSAKKKASRLKVVCQICGKKKTILLNEPIGPAPRWEFWKLNEVIEDLDEHQDYEIYLCPKCQENFRNEAEPEEFSLDWESLGSILSKVTKVADVAE